MTNHFTNPILEYLKARPNVEVTIGELAERFNVPREHVSSAIYYLKQHGETIINSQRGIYKYAGVNRHRAVSLPEARTPVVAAQHVHTLDDGRQVLEIDGDLWVARKLTFA